MKNTNNSLISIGETAKLLGVDIQTLRAWDKNGKLKAERTPTGHRRYDRNKVLSMVSPKLSNDKITIAYARVSSNDQKADLERQIQVLEMYCASNGYQFQIISDLGSGLNYHKKGLKQLIEILLTHRADRLVITHKDRLLRFGSELIFEICYLLGVEVVVINQTDKPSFEQELAKDVLEIITVFSAKLYGSRSHKNQKLINAVKENLTND